MPMHDLMQNTRTALRIYLERGQAALQALEAQTDGQAADDFTKALGLRDAAFHNFRALEALLTKAGMDIARDEEARRLAAEVQAVNDNLAMLLTEALTRLGNKINKVKKSQVGAKLYHSGQNFGPRLIKRA